MSKSFIKQRLIRWHSATLLIAFINAAFATASCSASDTPDRPPSLRGTYAIQSVLTEKNLRPYQANKSDGVKIVLYKHWRWKCMTWQFIRTEGTSYRLINRYTGKTFEMDSDLQPDIGLRQEMSGNSAFQEWSFHQLNDGSWLIKLRNSELYLTASSTENNSPVVLMPKTGSDNQRWKILAQDPWF